ncbi:unnamed protein product [Prunus armeniaca]|uniref:Uncharacterized protein n=1 Tax=Prunus armeniaca TaxID=36596 RepID=A0A6J5V2S2_PRUAR|nr:unnamed protein product [Prunus armeniaca]CAB4312903.1 unnamed protein product [Prunus armeniaca]
MAMEILKSKNCSTVIALAEDFIAVTQKVISFHNLDYSISESFSAIVNVMTFHGQKPSPSVPTMNESFPPLLLLLLHCSIIS